MAFLSNLFLVGFSGYLIGRWGHYQLNDWFRHHKWGVHHWIYGLVMMVYSFFTTYFPLLILCFGIGVFVSDLKDFTEFKLIEPDKDGKKKFWGFD